MSDYSAVERELAAGTPAELLCATCPWDRLCITPPTLTKQDIDNQIKQAEAKDREHDPDGKKMPVGMMLAALSLGGKDKTGTLCPVFTLRLRGPDGRQVADGVRAMMRDGIGGGEQHA